MVKLELHSDNTSWNVIHTDGTVETFSTIKDAMQRRFELTPRRTTRRRTSEHGANNGIGFSKSGRIGRAV